MTLAYRLRRLWLTKDRVQQVQITEDIANKIEEMDLELAELRYYHWRMLQILPLLQEARDALPAITEASRRLHGISPTLADRLDQAGNGDKARAAYQEYRKAVDQG